MEFEIRAGNVSTDSILGDYYTNLSSSVALVKNGLYGPFDANGVPLVDYDRLFRDSRITKKKHTYGVHHTPVTIAQYGLGLHNIFLKSNTVQDTALFLAQADWFLNNITITSSKFGVWLHHFEFPVYNLRPPWVSAMAQGQAISLLLRAYQMTHEKKYMETAHLAFQSFSHDISQGGVSTVDHEGHLWLEEFPTDPPTRVLNGFIFAIWGVLDYYRVTKNALAKEMYERCIQTLKHNLFKYECHYWSRYDLVRTGNTSFDYHRIHVLQLKILGLLEHDTLFGEYARRWEDYTDGKYRIRRLIKSKPLGLLRRLGLLKTVAIRGLSFKT